MHYHQDQAFPGSSTVFDGVKNIWWLLISPILGLWIFLCSLGFIITAWNVQRLFKPFEIAYCSLLPSVKGMQQGWGSHSHSSSHRKSVAELNPDGPDPGPVSSQDHPSSLHISTNSLKWANVLLGQAIFYNFSLSFLWTVWFYIALILSILYCTLVITVNLQFQCRNEQISSCRRFSSLLS